jgi:hypothetical protein
MARVASAAQAREITGRITAARAEMVAMMVDAQERSVWRPLGFAGWDEWLAAVDAAAREAAAELVGEPPSPRARRAGTAAEPDPNPSPVRARATVATREVTPRFKKRDQP